MGCASSEGVHHVMIDVNCVHLTERVFEALARFWCARENYEYNLKGLCEPVTVSTIFHYYQQYMRIMDA